MKLLGHSARLFFVALFCVLALPCLAELRIDQAINRSVWRMIYGLTDAQVNDPVWLSQDDDGDGLTNGAELSAGTNPLRATSTFALTNIAADERDAFLTFPTIKGKLYTVEFTTALDPSANWTGFDPVIEVMGNGAAQAVAAPRIPNGFYRVTVQDVDTDDDRVSDWAEIITGFNPTQSHTEGATLDDHAALSADLETENVITVIALGTARRAVGITVPVTTTWSSVFAAAESATSTVAVAPSPTVTRRVAGV